MAVKTLPELLSTGFSVSSISGTELLLVDQAGTSKVMTIDQLMDHFGITPLQQQVQTLSQELAVATRPDLYLKFNQNLIDETGNTVWTNVGGCGYSASPEGFALSKTSSQQGILCTDSGLDFSTNDFTIEMRFYINSFTKKFGGLLASGVPGFGWDATFIMVGGDGIEDANKRRIHLGGGGIGTPLIKSEPIVANQWYHLAITRRVNTVKMYIDRVLQAQNSCTGVIRFDVNGTMIGYNGWDGVEGYFDGKIDSIRVVRGRCLQVADFVL